jgi:hypothetical protein
LDGALHARGIRKILASPTYESGGQRRGDSFICHKNALSLLMSLRAPVAGGAQELRHLQNYLQMRGRRRRSDRCSAVCLPVEQQTHRRGEEMSKSGERNEDREQVQARLHPLLRNIFDRLLEDYEVSAKIHTGEVSVNYNIIADLVRAGWRRVLP